MHYLFGIRWSPVYIYRQTKHNKQEGKHMKQKPMNELRDTFFTCHACGYIPMMKEIPHGIWQSAKQVYICMHCVDNN